VQHAWEKPVNSEDASKILVTKLGRTAKALKKCDKKNLRKED
jgi:hypothetical protein